MSLQDRWNTFIRFLHQSTGDLSDGLDMACGDVAAVLSNSGLRLDLQNGLLEGVQEEFNAVPCLPARQIATTINNKTQIKRG